MAKQRNTTVPQSTVSNEPNTLEQFLGVEETTEVKVNEFAVAGKLQVLTLRELLMAETFGTLLGNLGPMIEPSKYEDHKAVIKQYLMVALDVALTVGDVYDERLGGTNV